MWSKFLTLAASIIQISSLLVQNQQEIDDLQVQFADMQANFKLLAQKLEHFTEMERAHHLNNLLELENRMLQMEKRLPPADSNAP